MPEWFLDMNKAINQVVWGVPMLLLLVGTGIYFTVSLRLIQLTRLRDWMRETFGTFFRKQGSGNTGGISPYRAAASALASTIGTGNVVGVATAIVAGGAGAVFWIWVAAFFGMATKYAEIVLAVKYRCKRKNGEFYGGPMYYIEKGIGAGWKWLAMLFAFSGALACPGMGGMNQANAISSVLSHGVGISPWISGVVLAAITAIAISGGIKRISALAEKIVPIMAIFYVGGGVAVMLMDIEATKNAFVQIFTEALSPHAVYGGAAGCMVSRAVRFGVARGVFTNEAGLGSAPIVHSAANAKSPITQGFWGIFEVFVDTIVICSVTAIVVIGSGLHTTGLDGAALTTAAFEKSLGSLGGVFVGIATILFALATILGWSYYGEQCMRYITRENEIFTVAYKALFIVFVMLGAISRVDAVWEIADTLNGIMAVPNLIAIIILSDVVIKTTRDELGIKAPPK